MFWLWIAVAFITGVVAGFGSFFLLVTKKPLWFASKLGDDMGMDGVDDMGGMVEELMEDFSLEEEIEGED